MSMSVRHTQRELRTHAQRIMPQPVDCSHGIEHRVARRFYLAWRAMVWVGFVVPTSCVCVAGGARSRPMLEQHHSLTTNAKPAVSTCRSFADTRRAIAAGWSQSIIVMSCPRPSSGASSGGSARVEAPQWRVLQYGID